MINDVIIKQKAVPAVKKGSVISHPLLERIYLSRGITCADDLDQSTKKLLDYKQLAGVDEASKILYDAAINHKKILVVGDFDTDGATSTALVMMALSHFGIKNVGYIIPDRFEDGYGLSVSVVDKGISLGADLIITVDNGISSCEAVAYAKKHNIAVIITDHHLVPEILPEADAIINPNQTNCAFASKNLAGVGVAFYFMLAFRAYLRSQNWFIQNNIAEYNLANLLDLVALGTVADVVELDKNNRILVKQGVARIRAGNCCFGIKALLDVAKKNINRITSIDLSYYLAPRINAAGRMDHMSLGVELLMAKSMDEASELAELLEDLNTSRKSVEQNMHQKALMFINALELETKTIPNSFVIYHSEFHQGVIGVLSSRIKERFYRPVISFAKTDDGYLKGSGRSIDGVHLRSVLEKINLAHPTLIICYGGHAMAAGLTIKEQYLDEFKRVFKQQIEANLKNVSLTHVIETDGEIENAYLNYETAKLLKDHGPWGAKFPEPVFEGVFNVFQQKLVADKHLKLVLEPINGGALVNAIAFNIDKTCWPDLSVKKIKIVYSLELDEFRGNQGISLLVRHVFVC